MENRGHGVLVALLAVTLCAGGCVSPLSWSADQGRLIESGRYQVIGGLTVPAVSGVEGCGAQGLAAVLAFEDAGLDAAKLAEELPWHDRGATPVDLLLEARRRGFAATIERGSWEALEENVRRGHPTLVMFDAAPAMWGSASGIQMSHIMHWSLVSGVSIDGSALVLAAPGGRCHVVARDDFLRRWARSDFCTIVVAPRDSPIQGGAAVVPWARSAGEMSRCHGERERAV